ncbi:MAG: hypothetical protein J6B28_09950 [Eubacterium sp.]|nr:hypothetical protein [Eubacterium sp.]
MDFHLFDSDYESPPVSPQPQDVMQTMATILSVIAIVTTCCIYSSLGCGALSIILALLARGQQKKLTPQGKLTIMTAIAAIVISVSATILMVSMTIQEFGGVESFLKEYSNIMESMTDLPLLEESSI